MKKPDLQTEGVISFYDGVWILKATPHRKAEQNARKYGKIKIWINSLQCPH